MHTLTSAQMQQLLGSAEVAQLSPAARQRLTWIADFVQNGKSVSATCAHFGIARSTFHRWLDRFDPADLSSLEERASDVNATRAFTVPAEIVEIIRGYRMTSPLVGKEKIRELLQREHNIELSASTIGRTIERECMYYGKTPLHWRKRMNKTSANEVKIMTVPAATVNVVSPVEHVTTATEKCACAWCALRGKNWKIIRRSIAVTSLVANIAFIGMMIATAFLEKQGQTVRADLTDNNVIGTYSTLDLPDDGR